MAPACIGLLLQLGDRGRKKQVAGQLLLILIRSVRQGFAECPMKEAVVLGCCGWKKSWTWSCSINPYMYLLRAAEESLQTILTPSDSLKHEVFSHMLQSKAI